MSNAFILGIDFGTTTLSAVVYNPASNEVVQSFNFDTQAWVQLPEKYKAEQSLDILQSLFNQLLNKVAEAQHPIAAIGFTGQMHGIIGLNQQGQAVTNLVTWQDRRGSQTRINGQNLLEQLFEKTGGLQLSDGYGLVTLYHWMQVERRTDISSFCTLADYFAMQLCNRTNPVMHPSMAHSIGAFELAPVYGWKQEILEKLGLQPIRFPQISATDTILGQIPKDAPFFPGIPVSVALGDNQASYLGSVGAHSGALLINVGTGTQLSFSLPANNISAIPGTLDTEIRPYLNDQWLSATSLTSGGNVYAALQNFFEQCARELFGMEPVDKQNLWTAMERCAREAGHTAGLNINPQLNGSRQHPDETGFIEGITLKNFNPGSLIYSFLQGMAQQYRANIPTQLLTPEVRLFGGGNGLKKNVLFCTLIEEVFERPLHLTPYNEEAATGSALFAAKCMA